MYYTVSKSNLGSPLPSFKSEACDLCGKEAGLFHTFYDGRLFRCPCCQLPLFRARARAGVKTGRHVAAAVAPRPATRCESTPDDGVLEELAVLVSRCGWSLLDEKCTRSQLEARHRWVQLMAAQRERDARALSVESCATSLGTEVA